MALGFGAGTVAALSRLPDRDAVDSNLEVLGQVQTPEVGESGESGESGNGPETIQATERPAEPTTSTTTEPAEPTGPPREFQTVITGGRVVDPETGVDQIANVGISNGTIAAITEGPVIGTEETIDASGLVVSPGFIDILSYEPNEFGIWFKVADGVTSNMAMHGVNARAASFVTRWEGRSPVNYGGAFDNPYMRSTLFGELNIGVEQPANQTQIDQMVEWAEEDLSSGFVGIDFEPEYSPGVEFAEMVALARVAEAKGMACYFHARYSDPDPPGTNAEAIDEIINVAKETGVAVHVEHLSSTGGTHTMAQSLATIASARDQGYDVTACIYPYTFWATTVASTRFATGWQDRFRISHGDLKVAGRPDIVVTEQNFRSLSAEFGLDNPLVAAMDTIPAEEIALALDAPFVMMGSDGILEAVASGLPPQNHPRGAGTFARTLGHYVRDTGTIGLLPALAKMTILPARRLESGAPAFARKGRLQEGMDADITIFDADTINDRATIDNPGQESIGIDWVLVDGQIIRQPGSTERPTNGKAITSA